MYPRRAGGNPKAAARKAFLARCAQGVPAHDLVAGAVRYAVYIRMTGKEGTEYVKMASSFFGLSEFWKEPWNLPAVPVGQSVNGSGARNDAGIDEWARTQKEKESHGER